MSWEDTILDTIGVETGKGVPILSPPIDIGKVIAPPPNLVIEVRGLEIRRDKGQLVINTFLLKDYVRILDIEWSDPYLHTLDTGPRTRHKKNVDATITTKDELKVGDEVVLIPFAGKQIWFVACKVVS